MLDNKKIMIVDDEVAVAGLVGEIVKEFDISPLLVYEPKRAVDLFKKERPFMVFSDLTMPGMDGVQLLEGVYGVDARVQYVIMTGYGSIESAIAATRQGAVDYIQKPLQLDYLRHLIGKALKADELVRENSQLKKTIADSEFPEIIGHSLALSSVMDTVRKVAPSRADIMVCGESGTGKELIARSIHKNSQRCNGPFVAVDCVALPRTLFESEMFGYEKGAFTGAEQRKEGLLQQANGGTLFIDEVTELDFDLQAKLLRVIQERQFRRVGGHELMDLDIRIVSATRRKPLEEVAKGTFRDDLYYRLSVIPLSLPPLRERREDVAVLSRNFLRQCAVKNNLPEKCVEDEVIAILERYDWPGNIRELKNICERLFVLSSEKISLRDLPPGLKPQTGTATKPVMSVGVDMPYKVAKEVVLGQFSEQYFRKMHVLERGNMSQVARRSGLSRKGIYDVLKKFSIHL